jgi:predicted alpha-1,2-mannosidase
MTQHVNPFLGVDRGGNCLCGPFLPFSLVRPGPDVVPPHPTSGYRSGQPIIRFSQTHVSGTGGGGRYGNIGVTPFLGEPIPHPEPQRAGDESAAPGRYGVTLQPSGIAVDLTCTPHVALHRYRFPKGDPANLLIDAGSVVQTCRDLDYTGRSIGGFVEFTGESELVGRADCRGGWGHRFPYSVFFAARVDTVPVARATAQGEGAWNRALCVDGADSRALWSFAPGAAVELRIGVSYVSIGHARASLARESDGRSFDEVRQAAAAVWADELDRVRVEGGTDDQRTLFYTSLYRLLCMPSDLGVDDEFPLWRSGVRQFTDFYCLWDSVRNANGLLALLWPERQAQQLNALLDVAAHTGWLPDAWIAGHSAHIQGGSSADTLFCEAALKGLPGIDLVAALRQCRKNNEVESPDPYLYGRYLPDYRDRGYVASEAAINCVSRHIEYSLQDCCIGRLAEHLGDGETAAVFYRSSAKLWNLWHDGHRSFAPRRRDGSWTEPFDPCKPEVPAFWNDPYFYEGLGHEWSLCALHDIDGLVARHGGCAGFVRHLDAFFGGIMKYWKEIILHTPFLYIHAGRPDRTAEVVHAILDSRYRNSRDGLPDNEDMGAHSAFYVGASMGLYPVMGQDLYWLTAPVFERVELRLAQPLTMVAPGAGTERGRYIVGARLNGRSLDRAWLTHAEVAAGGRLEFDLGPSPGTWGTQHLPHSPLPEALRRTECHTP